MKILSKSYVNGWLRAFNIALLLTILVWLGICGVSWLGYITQEQASEYYIYSIGLMAISMVLGFCYVSADNRYKKHLSTLEEPDW